VILTRVKPNVRFEVSKTAKIQILMFWVITQCTLLDGY